MSSMKKVRILEGSYRNQDIRNIDCELAGPIKFGAKGWFGHFKLPGETKTIRIRLSDEDSIEYLTGLEPVTKEVVEDEKQIIDRIKERFDIFGYSVEGIAKGDIRTLIISGAAGVGKTEMVTRILESHRRIHYEVVRGNIVSSYQLYQILFDNKDKDDILVLDDCDSALKDSNSLNILKAALESGVRPRIISYKSQSIVGMGIPTEFEYQGRIIFITNENFQRVIDKENNMSKHMKALIDRSLYLDLLLHSKQEVYYRIKEMVKDHGLLKSVHIQKKYEDEILNWIKENIDQIRSLSLRTPIHIAEMIKTNPKNWQRMANVFILRQ